jgi:hypothetical protein
MAALLPTGSEQRYQQERSGSEAFHRSRPSLPAGERPVKRYPLPGKPAVGSDARLCAPTQPHRDGSDGVRVPSRGGVWRRGGASVKFPEPTRSSTWARPRTASESRASRRATRRSPAAISTRRRGPRTCCGAERPREPETRCAAAFVERSISRLPESVRRSQDAGVVPFRKLRSHSPNASGQSGEATGVSVPRRGTGPPAFSPAGASVVGGVRL